MIALSFDNESFEARKEILREIKTLLKANELELNKLNSEYSRIDKSLTDINLQVQLKKAQVQSLEESISDLQKQKLELSSKLEMQTSLTGINEIRQENLNLKKEISREINQYSIELGKSESTKQHLEIELVTKENLQKEMDVLESILNAFSKNGIPAMALTTQLPIINKIVNDYLSGVVDFKLNFHTEVGVNTLEIYIQDENPKRVIELASGMEKMISSLAIRAALMQLTPLPKLDSIIIDEGFEALDSVNMNNVLKMLDKLKSNFRSVIIITHIPALKEYMDKILEIKVDTETKQSKIVYN
jgi:exonuclease SbcC